MGGSICVPLAISFRRRRCHLASTQRWNSNKCPTRRREIWFICNARPRYICSTLKINDGLHPKKQNIGESIISLMTANFGKDAEHYLVIFMAFALVYLVGVLYFDCQPTEEQIMTGNNTHAMRTSRWRARAYSWSHLVLYEGLLGLGVGMKFTAKHLSSDARDPMDVFLPAYSLLVVVLCIHVIRISHPFSNSTRTVWAVRAVAMLINFIMPFFYEYNHGVIMGIIIATVLVQVAVDTEGREHRKQVKHEAKEKAKEAVHRHTTMFEEQSLQIPSFLLPSIPSYPIFFLWDRRE